MKLSTPTKITFWIAVALAAIGLISFLVTIPVLSDYDFWFVLLGFIVLVAGNLLENI